MRVWGVLLMLGCLFAWQHRVDIQDWMHPAPPPTLPAGTQVVLYGTQWCGYCAKTRQLLTARNIPYREYDIENSDEGYAQYEQLRGNGVPLIVIRSDVIRGFDEDAINRALSKL